MKIDSYTFGTISIDGNRYTSDVIIYPDRVDSSWWRKEGHLLQIADIQDVVDTKPDVLIIGKGAMGVMVVPEETIEFIRSKGIEVHVDLTGKAVDIVNSLQGKKTVAAALHLTC